MKGTDTTIEAMIGTTTIEMRRETQLLQWGDYSINEATELLLRDGTILLFNLNHHNHNTYSNNNY